LFIALKDLSVDEQQPITTSDLLYNRYLKKRPLFTVERKASPDYNIEKYSRKEKSLG
jgi:hypothetical protein